MALMLAVPGQRDVLNAGLVRPGRRERDGRIDEVGPSIRRQLDHDIADVVDSVGVIADAPGHAIGASAAIQCVVAVSADEDIGTAVADEDIVETVACGVDVGRAGERDVLDARLVGARCREGHGGVDEIRPCIRGELNDHVADIIDGVGIVADAPAHGIGARAAIQGVVARNCL